MSPSVSLIAPACRLVVPNVFAYVETVGEVETVTNVYTVVAIACIVEDGSVHFEPIVVEAGNTSAGLGAASEVFDCPQMVWELVCAEWPASEDEERLAPTVERLKKRAVFLVEAEEARAEKARLARVPQPPRTPEPARGT